MNVEMFVENFNVCLCVSIQVCAMEGVVGIRQPHFWQHSSDTVIGTIHIQALPEAAEQKIIQEVLYMQVF